MAPKKPGKISILSQYFQFAIRQTMFFVASAINPIRKPNQSGKKYFLSHNFNLHLFLYSSFFYVKMGIKLWKIVASLQYNQEKNILEGIFMFFCCSVCSIQFWKCLHWKTPSISNYTIFHPDTFTRYIFRQFSIFMTHFLIIFTLKWINGIYDEFP